MHEGGAVGGDEQRFEALHDLMGKEFRFCLTEKEFRFENSEGKDFQFERSSLPAGTSRAPSHLRARGLPPL